jgi:toxin FitB
MILLDTNVVSQTMNPGGSPSVFEWMNARDMQQLYICAPVIAEIGYGVARLPSGARKSALASALERMADAFLDRTLPFDAVAASHYGPLRVLHNTSGRAAAPVDMMIAAIALTHNLTLATRNTRDFEGLGVKLINPFTAP